MTWQSRYYDAHQRVVRLYATRALSLTRDGDANTGSDDDADSGQTHTRGARSETRLAVWHRSALGRSCPYSEAG